jgi:hypothetical protein
MKYLIFLFISIGVMACKTSEKATSKEEPKRKHEKPYYANMKNIIIDPNRGSAPEPDFEMVSWTANRGVLEVIVTYTGGCDEHIFNAYFSGMWLKSQPAQAMIEIEHLNPKNDPCRSIVKDTLTFDLKPIRYPAADEVFVNWSSDPLMKARYKYDRED